ncbi:MAG: DNA polymerase III subunit delta' [Actinomycetales bacterium]
MSKGLLDLRRERSEATNFAVAPGCTAGTGELMTIAVPVEGHVVAGDLVAGLKVDQGNLLVRTGGGAISEDLVGQEEVVERLARAVDDAQRLTQGEPGPAMTHAWLVTGPPGSGRSTAATCFAAALACPERGCGRCQACRLAGANGHPDVEVIRPAALTYGVDEARELVRQAAMSPTTAHWHVVVLEDADRLTDQACNVLLKAIEEPPPHTVWVMCAPSIEDVLPTIASRTRHVALATPSATAVADLLADRYGIDRSLAAFAARASQGHIGRARALATDEHARMRRQEILRIPGQLHDLPACFVLAGNLLQTANEDAAAITSPMDEAEEVSLRSSYGASVASSLDRLHRGHRRHGVNTRRHDSVWRDSVEQLCTYGRALFRQFWRGVMHRL